MDLPVTDLRLRTQLLDGGFTDGELQRLRRTGAVPNLRRGAYVPFDDARLQVPDARHTLLVRAMVSQLAAGSVVSHVSAAVLHGLHWAGCTSRGPAPAAGAAPAGCTCTSRRWSAARSSA